MRNERTFCGWIEIRKKNKSIYTHIHLLNMACNRSTEVIRERVVTGENVVK